jgi:tetratricopeptide (TPR) repeat protein
MSQSPTSAQHDPAFAGSGDTSQLAGEAGAGQPTPRRRLSVRLVVLAAIAVVIIPAAVLEYPREIARWKAAAAREAYLDGRVAVALAGMDDAISRHPDDARFYLMRSEYRERTRDFHGSLEDAERAVELAPLDPQSYQRRIEAYHHAGRYEEALEDWNRIGDMLDRSLSEAVYGWFRGISPERANFYNGRAYTRALAGTELDVGLEEIDRAIRAAGANYAYLDTRGMLYLKRGDLDKARADFDAAVEAIEYGLANWPAAYAKAKHETADLREVEQQHHRLRQTVAVLRYHRALLFEKLDEPELAEEDLKRVRELGFEPDEHLF